MTRPAPEGSRGGPPPESHTRPRPPIRKDPDEDPPEEPRPLRRGPLRRRRHGDARGPRARRLLAAVAEEAVHKGADSAKGRIACASHVATYTAVSTAAVVAVDRYLGLDLDPRRIAAGQLLSAATHYAADRREPLRRLACWAGKRPFWESGGAPHLDQAAHKIVLTLAAAITAGGAR
ncbi:hypothetical protein ACFQXA_00165 [Nocardiopsis composta]